MAMDPSPLNLDPPHAAPAPSFRLALFIKYLTSVVSVLLLLGVAAYVVWFAKPMQLRAAAASSGTRPPELRIVWPATATPKPAGAAPADKADPKAAAAPAPPPTWLPRQFQEELLTIARAALSSHPDPFSGEPLRRLSDSLVASGWFEGAPNVRREGDGLIVVDGRWRIPAAVVHADGKFQMISWQGLLMPPTYAERPKGLLLITGTSDGIPRDAQGRLDFAHAWPGEDVAASLELLALLVQQKWASQVAGIDASDFPARKSLTILTTGGTRVVWGGRPAKPNIGDAATSHKLQNIATLVRDTKRIDGGYPLVYLNSPTPQFDISATAKAAAKVGGTPAPPIASGERK